MPTIPQLIASAFAVVCGQYGDVTKMAKDREQSRQSLYREAEQVANAVDGAAVQARDDEQPPDERDVRRGQFLSEPSFSTHLAILRGHERGPATPVHGANAQPDAAAAADDAQHV